ncbi:Uncharacterized protein BP5553_03201 [Venustampulla echinocandica]|uniref:S-adenosyl-L-methionine-dependent methyltransferase n=1 Tax=Venustampulla echinocandica TaxID=2656787 RepID=A0A370TTL0_9HELO|nr:Uncharacterized protein BP5553_03201 [Venustampulla echinocandica]RDL38861.1 Uncharacterized protein BP5553_03201 [Venustampulla echinocandica]
MASHPDEGTSSLDDSFLETVTIHNREYQQYSITNYVYLAPIDEDEVERLQIMHDVLSRVFDQRLIFPPITRPRRILDAGYGAASWALEVAEQHPQCEVIGVDINPWQPEERPNNLYLQVEDLNGGISFPSRNFDLVHSQMMATGIHANRWASYLQDMFRVTRGGGWCQMVELYFNVQSDNGSLTDAHALRQWSSRYLESHEGLKDLRVPLRLPTLMREAGFVNVEHRMLQLHTCAWSTDQRDNDIGAINRENVQRFLSSLAIYPFTERLGMAVQDAHLLIAQARLEADNPAFKVLYPSIAPQGIVC